MRISFILEDGRYGGPHAYAISLINQLKENNDIEILLPKKSSQVLISKLKSSKIHYKLFPLTYLTRQITPLIKYVLFFFFEIIYLVIYFKKNNIDIVYACGGSWQFKAIIAAKISNRKVIWHLNDTYAPKVILYVFKKLNNIPVIYICASELTKKYYSPYFNKDKPVSVIPSPIDTDFFTREYLNNNLILGNETTIGIVANVNPIKNLEMFLGVATILNNEFDNLKFVVVGAVWESQKKYFSKLQKIIQRNRLSNIEFIGQQDNIKSLLSSFDLYLCTSRSESSPIAIWEAMSMGCAIVSTDVGDVSQYIKSNISGEIVRVGDIKEMAKKASFILNNSNIMSLYQVNCQKIARQKFASKICAKSHLEAFKLI
jgi:glycosyltransferase involved in cell wall biosynthesis